MPLEKSDRETSEILLQELTLVHEAYVTDVFTEAGQARRPAPTKDVRLALYSHEQGLTSRQLTPEELFVAID